MKEQSQRKHFLIDAQGQILGRLATRVAKAVSGKGKVNFAPHIDGGDFVVVVNTDGMVVTGKKLEDKIYHRFSGYPGGITSIRLKDQMKKDSRKVLEMAVYGMLPKNKLRDRMMTRLLFYPNAEQKHAIDETLTL
ncbi:MAG: 50S ribosomal protein L13 [Candidatus Moraniibacteriota bacterium]|nr:MAG: 50S ribosomal protein L13 [Candidatus Moranbacteria bacterium]